MKASVRHGLILGAGLLFSVNASAILMTVEATGTVYSSYDYNGNYSGTAGHNALNGRQVTATWTFDTDYMPSDVLASDTSQARHDNHFDSAFQNQSWITSTVTLGGVGNPITEQAHDDSDISVNRDYLLLRDEYVGRDHYQIYSHAQGYSYTGSENEYTTSYAYIYEYIDEILDGLDPTQGFSWEDNDASDYGAGYFQMYDNDPLLSVWGRYAIDTFTVTAGAAAKAVPEPGTLALLALGIAGLGVARRKQA